MPGCYCWPNKKELSKNEVSSNNNCCHLVKRNVELNNMITVGFSIYRQCYCTGNSHHTSRLPCLWESQLEYLHIKGDWLSDCACSESNISSLSRISYSTIIIRHFSVYETHKISLPSSIIQFELFVVDEKLDLLLFLKKYREKEC